MKISEIINEGRNHPVVVVDVQPEYAFYSEENTEICDRIIEFVNGQSGPVLMFVNAEDTGVSGDTVSIIKEYWENSIRGDDYDPEDHWDDEYERPESPINWNRFATVDKGFGHFRNFMDQGISDAAIIKLIRYMYQQKVSDSRQLFGGDDSDGYAEQFEKFIGPEFQDFMLDESFMVEWTSVAQLKRFSGAYIVGGGRNECLREVELLMNAFNVKYRRIDHLVYG